jgi:hypothetical protein
MTMTHHSKIRGFRLVVEPASADSYGLRLEEMNGTAVTPPKLISQVRPNEVPDVADILQQALRESHQARTALSSGRRKPIPLGEAAGVRLALALIAIEPVAKASRRSAILSGIAAMSTEEAYYWFARTTGPIAPRARRALRILLADDGRTGLTS